MSILISQEEMGNRKREYTKWLLRFYYLVVVVVKQLLLETSMLSYEFISTTFPSPHSKLPLDIPGIKCIRHAFLVTAEL